MAKKSEIEHVKLPPQALEVEEVVLGALMIEGEVAHVIVPMIEPEVFYKPEHKYIYLAITRLYKKKKPIDIITVINELREMKYLETVGGPITITTLTNRVGSAANIEYHAQILIQKWMGRKVISFFSNAITKIYNEEDVVDIMDEAQRMLMNMNVGKGQGMTKHVAEVGREVSKEVKLIAAGKIPPGVPTGFRTLDQAVGGWMKTDLIIIAARPGAGKSSLMLKSAKNAALLYKKNVVVFSLEMGATQLVGRLAAEDLNKGLSAHDRPVSVSRIRKGDLNAAEIAKLDRLVDEYESLGLYINDSSRHTILTLFAEARKMVIEHKVEIIMVDYLQLMAGDSHSRNYSQEQIVSDISRGLKVMAKELNVPVIALSQLSRASEQRGGSKRPMLSDLRSSGSIEQDADMVLFIHRPEYYGELVEAGTGRDLKGIAEIIIAKQRNGGLGTVELGFNAQLATFQDLAINQSPIDYAGEQLTMNLGGEPPFQVTEDLPF